MAVEAGDLVGALSTYELAAAVPGATAGLFERIEAARAILAAADLAAPPGDMLSLPPGSLARARVALHPGRKLTILAGKGGVGKTTLAAALALLLGHGAASGKPVATPVLLFSTDPAHNLADILGAPVGASPVAVAENVLAEEIDAVALFEETMPSRRPFVCW
jgi:Mrp family chromosome partitioning ATPase